MTILGKMDASVAGFQAEGMRLSRVRVRRDAIAVVVVVITSVAVQVATTMR